MELNAYIDYLAAFILVLALIGICAWLAKFALTKQGNWLKGKDKRLSLIDAIGIDNKRRLVLVRKDDLEHLILIGGPNDLLIEQGQTLPSSQIIEGGEDNE